MRSASRSKYKNVKTGEFDSKREAKLAETLLWAEKCGVISELRFHVRFPIIEEQECAPPPADLLVPVKKIRKKERKSEYEADAVYRDSAGQLVVLDAKGYETPEFILKRKLMLKQHKITVYEV